MPQMEAQKPPPSSNRLSEETILLEALFYKFGVAPKNRDMESTVITLLFDTRYGIASSIEKLPYNLFREAE